MKAREEEGASEAEATRGRTFKGHAVFEGHFDGGLV